MSRATPKTDVERTAIMLDLLHRRYMGAYSHLHREPGPRFVMMEEVAPSTGGVSRLADLMVLSCWRSDGLALNGWEIKASRADLKRELADPGKSQALSRYCDSWSLLVWDADVSAALPVPETWGLFVVKEDDGAYELKTIRAAPRRTPDPWPKAFIASMVRNAFTQSPGSIYLGRACGTAYKEGVESGQAMEAADVRQVIDPLRKHLYGEKYWNHPGDLPTIVADAIKAMPSRSARAAAAVDAIVGHPAPIKVP